MANNKKNSLSGPGMLITAAFIGPGTVTVCTLAGVKHGLQLLWAVLLSILMTMLFQEMAARLGIVTRKDLASLIKSEIKLPVLKIFTLIVVMSAIVVGNGVYEAGNISGGALGLDTFIPSNGFKTTPLIIGSFAFLLLWFGNHKVLEIGLAILVAFMSIAFVVAAILVKPDISTLAAGLFLPQIPEKGMLDVLGLVGTTIVPYNLFLHASLAKDKWKSADEVKDAKRNTVSAIAIGGVISLAIVVSASALQGEGISSATDLAKGLAPLFGEGAKYLISLGLFAAGITSAITAPLAAAYVMAGGFGWEAKLSSTKFRLTWIIILAIGVLFASIGFKPIEVIRFAQVANGLLLPIIGFLLVWLCSKSSLLGTYKNKTLTTVLASVFVLLITILGLKSIWGVIA
ncbi:Nramp family divalent metal transporter [Flammeovirgaceae bacterium SG7u.111]|nr:Nramp family divalent metal transporter [Flammeovirgaceae bacterium SG7u.132]WPO34135.1 Nramp family divalent metal transporter [Flammeovirgaceae bacterium SG7u.111]